MLRKFASEQRENESAPAKKKPLSSVYTPRRDTLMTSSFGQDKNST